MGLADALDAIPVVSSTTERGNRFPTPATDQRVFNKATAGIERFTGISWVTDFFGYPVLPAEGSTVVNAGSPYGDVRRFGALGDGATNDKPAFKLAVAACAIGGTVIVPRTLSYYKIDISAGESDAILLDKKITIEVEGEIRSTVGAVQANPPTIFRVTAKDVTFEGTGVIKGDGTTNALNSGADATLPSLIKVEADGFTFNDITIDTPYKIGIYLYGCYGARISAKFTGGPTTYGSPGTTGYFAIRGYQGGRHIISSSLFYPDLAGGMYVSCIFLSNSNWCVVDGNVAYRPYEKLIYAAASYTTISNNIVIGRDPAAGNIPGTNQQGTLGPVYRVDGIYNKIIGNFSMYGGGAQSLGGAGTDISDNTFIECGSGGISILETGATRAFDHIKVHDNLIVRGQTPLPIGGSLIGDGILIRTPAGFGQSSYLSLKDNTVIGFAQADPTLNIPGRAPSTAYSVDTHSVRPSAGANGFYYVVTVSGISSAGGDPVWPLVAGNTVVDGTVTWLCVDPDTALRAQIRVVGPGAGSEVYRAVISDNNLAGGLRGLRTDRMDNSKVSDNRVHATTWWAVESNGSSNRYEFNTVEGPSNAGVQTLAATSDVVDYRRGTWTPVVSDGTNDMTMAGSGSNDGRYVRIGRMVTITANIVCTAIGAAAGAVRIKGLPFAPGTAAGDAASVALGFGSLLALPVAGMNVGVVAVGGQLYLTLHKWSAVGGTTALTAAEWTGVGQGSISLTYFTNDP